MILRSRLTASLFGGQVQKHTCDSEDEHEVETVARTQFRGFEESIKCQQKAGVNQDGFILYQDNVYQVFAVNGTVKKITGQLAKDVKRQIKAAL